MNEPTAQRLLVLLVIIYVGLGATYAVVMPCFEASDEWSHLTLTRYFATHDSLPPMVVPPRRAVTGADVAYHLEYHDPPLYYAPPLYYWLAGQLVSWADMSDMPYLMVPNPNWERGWVPEPDGTPWNKNLYAHRAEENLRQSGTVQAALLLRAVSLGLGAVVVVCTYVLARLLWRNQMLLALGAAAFVALLPKFIAVSAGVTNDSLLNAFFSLFFVCALRSMRDGASWHRWASLGVVVGLGLLTKQNALLLIPLGCLAVVWQQKGASSHRYKVWMDSGAFLVAALGVGGWWYVRNGILYGDPLGLEPHFASQVSLSRFGLTEVMMVARSYWAAFGWAPILVEPPMYAVAGLVALIGLAGAVVAVLPGRFLSSGETIRSGAFWEVGSLTRRALILLGMAFALNVASLLRWAIATGAPVGRLLFSTLPVIALLMAWGFYQWRRLVVVRWGLSVVVVLMFLLATIIPWRYLRPAYGHPRLVDGVPDGVQSVDLAFQGDVDLMGYEPIAHDLKPGEELRLTVYWYTPESLGRRYRTWVQLAPWDATKKVAEHDTWLGGTLYPSDLWPAGDTVRQIYPLSVAEWASAPGLYWIRVGLVDDGGDRVALVDQDSDAVVLGPLRMLPATEPPSPACGVEYRLGTSMRLLGYGLTPGQGDRTDVELALYWQADEVPGTDYTVFVHLVDNEGRLLAQQDGPPRGGTYPTSWWLPDQVVEDVHAVSLGEPYTGSAQLRVGLYEPTTVVRLPVYDRAGQHLEEDFIRLPETMSGKTPCVLPDLSTKVGADG